MFLFIFVCIVIFLIVLFFVSKKSLKMGDYVVLTGKVKSGKSTLSLSLSKERYRKVHFKWRLKHFFITIFYKYIRWFYLGLNKVKKANSISIPEEPLFYSNIPVAWKHVRITKDLILRNERFRYKSVIYIDEASLLIDSQTIKDKELNLETLLFNKLIAHETRGGSIFMNSQNIMDLHYNIKRCTSTYLFVHKCIKWIPFILVFKVRELVNSESLPGSTSNFNEDVDSSSLYCWCWKSIWKKFDCYCYSVLTDDLPVQDKIILYDKKNKNFKSCNIVTFNKDLDHKLNGGD